MFVPQSHRSTTFIPIDLCTVLRESKQILMMTQCRYLLDNLDELYIGLSKRVCETHAMLPSMIALLKTRPWEQTSEGKLEQFAGGTWHPVPPGSGKLCQAEGQASTC